MEPIIRKQDIPSGIIMPRERAGFVSFYLWMALILNALMGLAYFATIFTKKGMWSAYDPMWTRAYGFVSSMILFYGYHLLLRWHRNGFFVLVLMAGVSVIINLCNGGGVSVFSFSPFFGIAILYAVLQIRKNGKSCWDQLSI